MNRPPKTKLVAVLGGALLAFSALAVNAAGLGKLSINSALGQPLSAEIELVSLQPGEFDAVTARVASPESYSDARIEYSPLLRQLRFATERRANGTPILKITSNAPVNEPFLDVLVEMNWPSGRLLREYPILLDPPGFNEARIAPPVVAVARPTAPVQGSVTPSVSALPPTAGSPSARAETAGDTYGPVKSGDTLSKIAKEMKSDTVSLEQMLVALYRENKAAFIDNNMNRLRTGQILRVPAAMDVASVSEREARGEVKVQVANWNAYREQVAGAAPSSQPKAASNEATGKITVAKPEVPAPVAAPKDQLKIAKTEAAPGKVGSAGASGAMQDQVNALKEEKIARENALKEANSRVADLEKQIATMRKLAEIKGLGAPVDTKLAAKPIEKEAPKVEAKPAPVVPPADVKVATVTPPPVAPVPVTPVVTPVDASKTPAKVDAKPAEPAPIPPKADVVAAAKPPPAAKAVPPKKAAPPPQTDFIDDYGLIIGAGAAAVLGIGGLLLFMARRKKKRPASSTSMSRTSSIMPSDLKPNTVTGNKGGGLVDTGNSSFLTDFDKTGPGNIDTDEVDPLAEADVYIAYGRDAQAEEILKEALGRDKSRHEITLKLLEIYHNRKSTQAFETVAREFKESVGEASPHWAKAAAMGSAIDPQNTLYAGSGAAYATTGAFMSGGAAVAAMAPAASDEPVSPPDLDFDLGFTDTPGTHSSAIDISAPNSDQPAPLGGTDFDLDLEMPAPKAPPAESSSKPDAPGGGLDFDLALDEPAVPVAPAAEASSFDFDLSSLSLDEPSHLSTQKISAVPQEQFSKTAAPVPKTTSFSDLSLDLDEPATTGGTDSGAAATKLELAKAYVEIGDSDGAKEILQEVVREGSSAQQSEAKKLLASL